MLQTSVENFIHFLKGLKEDPPDTLTLTTVEPNICKKSSWSMSTSRSMDFFYLHLEWILFDSGTSLNASELGN